MESIVLHSFSNGSFRFRVKFHCGSFVLGQIFLHLEYGVQKISFQGVRVVSHRRDRLEISLKTKPLIFLNCQVFFCKNNPEK